MHFIISILNNTILNADSAGTKECYITTKEYDGIFLYSLFLKFNNVFV